MRPRHFLLPPAFAACLLLVLAACGNVQYGLPTRGYGYPSGLLPFAPRLGKSGNYTYYPRYEAYLDRSTKLFCYPSGKTWVTRPTVLSSTPREVLSSPSVPFQFPDHPSKYHEMVKQAFPISWTNGQGRFDEGYEFGRSSWDLDRR